MVQKIEEAAGKNWDKEYQINYILNNHTWDKRVEIYDKVIKDHSLSVRSQVRRHV